MNSCQPILLTFEKETKLGVELYKRENIVYFLVNNNTLSFTKAELSFSDKIKVIQYFKEKGLFIL